MQKPIFKDFKLIVTPEVIEGRVKIVMDIIESKEQTTKLIDASDLRNIADYLDWRRYSQSD